MSYFHLTYLFITNKIAYGEFHFYLSFVAERHDLRNDSIVAVFFLRALFVKNFIHYLF